MNNLIVRFLLVWLSIHQLCAFGKVGELSIINPTLFEVTLSIYEHDNLIQTVDIDPLDGVSLLNSVFEDDETKVRIVVDKKNLSKVYDAKGVKARAKKISSIAGLYDGPVGVQQRYLNYLIENLRLSGVRNGGLKKFIRSEKNPEVSQSYADEFKKAWLINMAAVATGAAVGKAATYVSGCYDYDIAGAVKGALPQTVSEAADTVGQKVFDFGMDCQKQLMGGVQKIHGAIRGVPEELYEEWYTSACRESNNRFIENHALNWFVEQKYERAGKMMYGALGQEALSGAVEDYVMKRQVHWLEMVIVEEFVESTFALQLLDDTLARKLTADLGHATKEKIGDMLKYIVNTSFINITNIEKVSKNYIEVNRPQHRTIFLTAPEGI